jgi:hypothetical protein
MRQKKSACLGTLSAIGGTNIQSSIKNIQFHKLPQTSHLATLPILTNMRAKCRKMEVIWYQIGLFSGQIVITSGITEEEKRTKISACHGVYLGEVLNEDG